MLWHKRGGLRIFQHLGVTLAEKHTVPTMRVINSHQQQIVKGDLRYARVMQLLPSGRPISLGEFVNTCLCISPSLLAQSPCHTAHTDSTTAT